MKQVYRGLLALFCCLPFLAHAASTDIGFAPWTQKAKWYRAAAESDLTSLTPDSFTGGIACAWAVSENSVHTWNGSSWTSGGPCESGSASVGISSIVPGTGATNAGKARSSSAGATDTGFAPWAVRDDALSTVAEDEGEYTPLKATSTGGLWMSIATPLGDSAMDDTNDAVKVNAVAGSVSITGGNETEDIAASQTDQALGATGAVGDRFGGFMCNVTATLAAAVTVEDGAGSAFTLIQSGALTGTYVVTDLDWISTSGAWEFTTPADVSCKAWGDFT